MNNISPVPGTLGRHQEDEALDSCKFIDEIERELVPISPILEFAIKKQLADIGASRDYMSAEQAVDFIKRMTEALELFLGAGEARKAKKMMTSVMRQCAPEYFEEHSLI